MSLADMSLGRIGSMKSELLFLENLLSDIQRQMRTVSNRITACRAGIDAEQAYWNRETPKLARKPQKTRK